MFESEDKIIEKERFDTRAIYLLENDKFNIQSYGSLAMPLPLRSPYLYYEQKIKELIKPEYKVLEIGSGTGLHTYSLIKTGAIVTATDISSNSLKVLEKNLSKVEGGGRLKTMVADMEKLPFKNESFDMVTSAGSLSYGEAKKVDSEIRRVIKPGGFFICVDSLNNNPIYRSNRYINYLANKRSKITILNMPTIDRLDALKNLYKSVDVIFFGSISCLMPFIKIITGIENAKKISDFVDKLFCVKKSAFKFVLTAKA
ncbi:MAG: class I SAM-dependent methyltransferase [Bacteroidetes bacterium]|nr:class I SAM-dependent methyltransferase [Bacteroidota bacterium]